MEDTYKINGGKKLTGTVRLSGAKNVALKTIIAALMFDSEVILENVPRINDVTELLHLVTQLGAQAAFTDENTVRIDGRNMKNNQVDMLHSTKIRVSFMLFAPLLHKFKECYVPNPGGCRIGARPIDRIIEGMQKLGVQIEYNSSTGFYKANLSETIRGEYFFIKSSHTGTELLTMLGAIGKDKVVIENAAFEPEIDELITFLNEAGARIKRVDNKIEIEGVDRLEQKKPFRIVSDRNEAVTFAVLGIATKGEVILEDISPALIQNFLEKLEECGGGVEHLSKSKIRFYYKEDIHATEIETSPHPGFMTDWQPNWAILMTQAHGDSIIHERVFESRFMYVKELRKLGAKIEFISPEIVDPISYYHFAYNPKNNYQQAIRITGPSPLHGGVLSINDLRAGASVVIAALIANGESLVKGASILERGYEKFIEKVTALGGDITKI
jgi:UDP-N-acetylglucosamine 1-carboxyvinyltransferase